MKKPHKCNLYLFNVTLLFGHEQFEDFWSHQAMSTDLYVVPKEINCEQNETLGKSQLTFSYSKNRQMLKHFARSFHQAYTFLFLERECLLQFTRLIYCKMGMNVFPPEKKHWFHLIILTPSRLFSLYFSDRKTAIISA